MFGTQGNRTLYRLLDTPQQICPRTALTSVINVGYSVQILSAVARPARLVTACSAPRVLENVHFGGVKACLALCSAYRVDVWPATALVLGGVMIEP